MAMETKKHFLWGPSKEEADIFSGAFGQLTKQFRKDPTGMTLAVKGLVAGLGRQERATFKVICHMLRKCCYAPNALMDATKMGLCVRAAIQGAIAVMIDDFDVIFGDMVDVD